MATSCRNEKSPTNATEHTDSIQLSLDKLLSLSAEDTTETDTLRSRIDQQACLIGTLKRRADELLLRCQALQKINAELENRVADCQRELDGRRERTELLERRFMDLAATDEALIALMNEHKNEKARLAMENKRLRKENDTIFSQKLHDKEMLVQKVMQEMKLLTEDYTNKENEYREKLADCPSKLLEQAAQHQAKEESLLDQLHDAQQQKRDAVETCKDLRLKLERAGEEHALKEMDARECMTSLAKENDRLLSLSTERERVIQEREEEIQQLARKWKEEKKSRAEAEERFKQDAEAVNVDVKVRSLQSALDESTTKHEKLQKDFEAFREHSASLLTQERELNKKLLLMTG